MVAENKGKLASATGFANESRFLGALLARGYNASKVDLPHSTYDIVVELGVKDIIRVQVKTVGGGRSVSFTGGVRGGADRTYRSDVKSYRQSTETADIVVGVDAHDVDGGDRVDFYFIPTIYIEHIGQGSLSISKIPAARNNWDLLRNCGNPEFVYNHFGILVKQDADTSPRES